MNKQGSNVEADYVNLDHGIDGWGLRGSAELGSTGFYGLGSYSWTKLDAAPSDLDIKSNELGIGYHHSLNANTDLLDYNGDFSGTVGGQVKLNQTWGATAEAELGNGDQAYLVGVRASF